MSTAAAQNIIARTRILEKMSTVSTRNHIVRSPDREARWQTGPAATRIVHPSIRMAGAKKNPASSARGILFFIWLLVHIGNGRQIDRRRGPHVVLRLHRDDLRRRFRTWRLFGRNARDCQHDPAVD